MKTTLDLPAELLATLENTATREHRDVSEVACDALVRGLEDAPGRDERPADAGGRRVAMEDWLRGWRELGATIHTGAAHPRSMLEILRADRESRG